MNANMRAGLVALLLLLLAGSSAAQTMPPACKPTFKTNGAALMAAMGGLKKACPPGAQTCSAACKAAFNKVGATEGAGRRAVTLLRAAGPAWLPPGAPPPPACQPPLTHLRACPYHPVVAAGPPNCWKAAMAPLGAATVNSVAAGWKACKL
jgi:hypothetical protein